MSHGSKKAVYAALIGNAAIMLIKFAVAALTLSTAMLAEAFHSLADMGNQALLLLGISRSVRPADERHPFGHGKEQYFWSFIVALVLFLMGAVVSIFEGIQKLIHPHAIERVYLIYVILGVSLLIEGASWSVAFREFLRGKGNRGLLRALRELRDPSIMVVLVEDTAAVAGLSIAFAGTALVQATGNGIWDALASIAIGCVLGAVAWFLSDEMRKLLLGESASREDLAAIREVISRRPEVERVVEVLTMHMGPEQILLAAHVDFRDDVTAGELEGIVPEIEAEIKARVPAVKHIFIEGATGGSAPSD